MNLRKQAHAVYYTRYHLVFATRFRRKVLKAGMGQYLCILMKAINRRHPEIEIYEVNTDQDPRSFAGKHCAEDGRVGSSSFAQMQYRSADVQEVPVS